MRWQETSTPSAVQLIHQISEHQIQHRSATEATKPVNSLNKRQVLPVTHPAALLVVFKFLSSSLHSISWLDSLPPTGGLPHCLSNWNRITSDLWTLEVVKGYQLELVSLPYQDFIPGPPCWSKMNCALITDEVEKLSGNRPLY